MDFRKTTVDDASIVADIYECAKKRLKDNNIDQWQEGYPNVESVLRDIENGESYVILDEGKIVSTCMISNKPEPHYEYIEGNWLNNDSYIVIHRVASNSTTLKKGYASYCFNIATQLFPNCKSIRIDTHFDNIAMQNMLKKNGFIECGVVYVANNAKRLAFQKIINT